MNNSDILYTFMPSEEMRDHLLNRNLTDAEIMRLILGAPVALQTKAEYCRRLMCRDDKFYDFFNGENGNASHISTRPGYEFEGWYVFAKLDDDGNIQLTGGTVSSSGNTYTLGLMIYIAEAKSAEKAFSITSNYCSLPNVLINPANILSEDSARFAAQNQPIDDDLLLITTDSTSIEIDEQYEDDF